MHTPGKSPTTYRSPVTGLPVSPLALPQSTCTLPARVPFMAHTRVTVSVPNTLQQPPAALARDRTHSTPRPAGVWCLPASQPHGALLLPPSHAVPFPVPRAWSLGCWGAPASRLLQIPVLPRQRLTPQPVEPPLHRRPHSFDLGFLCLRPAASDLPAGGAADSRSPLGTSHPFGPSSATPAANEANTCRLWGPPCIRHPPCTGDCDGTVILSAYSPPTCLRQGTHASCRYTLINTLLLKSPVFSHTYSCVLKTALTTQSLVSVNFSEKMSTELKQECDTFS